MNVSLFTSENWNSYEKWFQQNASHLDIYYYPSYLTGEARLVNGECQVFICEDVSGSFFIYPFIKRQIPVIGFEEYFDISSPYGYCGPVTRGSNNNLFLIAEKELCNYLENQNIVNEFVRYHYTYNQDLLFENKISNVIDRKIIMVDTTASWEEIWQNQFSSTNRNLVRKMENDGYAFRFVDDDNIFNHFIEMYYETMDNVNANSFYYFPVDYFLMLKASLGDHLKLCVVEKDGIIYSSALFYVASVTATYYLSARNLAYPKVASVNYLLSQSIKYFQEKSISLVNLGGGSNGCADNLLLKFKKNFSKNAIDFWIGKRVHLPDIYDEMKKTFISINGEDLFKSKIGVLQFYR